MSNSSSDGNKNCLDHAGTTAGDLLEVKRRLNRSVPCPQCGAGIGDPCSDRKTGAIWLTHHNQRTALANKLPGFGDSLDPTDKAMICYYAYTMICDSVAAHSLEVMGRRFNSQEIQRFFASKAIEELRKDGLLGKKN